MVHDLGRRGFLRTWPSAQAEDVAAQLCPEARLIAEPCGRSTAPAVALAALQASPETLLLVMPSDHLIAEPARFVEAVRSGLAAAERRLLVAFGVSPCRPETGFGYIRRGKAVGDGLFEVERFVASRMPPRPRTSCRAASMSGTPASSCSPPAPISTRWPGMRRTSSKA